MKIWALAWIIISASPLHGQTMRDQIMPELGRASVASVGETVYEKSRFSVLPAYMVLDAFNGKNIFATVTISPGDKFVQIPSKVPVKACRSPSIEKFLEQQYDACLYDDDGNGTFDRFGGNEVQGGKKLPFPMPYKKAELIQSTSGSLKQVVIYLGSTRDTLRLSYREFLNDMARPAFTEEYTFPLNEEFPQPVSFKGVKLSVTKIDGEGLHYTLLSAPNNETQAK